VSPQFLVPSYRLRSALPLRVAAGPKLFRVELSRITTRPHHNISAPLVSPADPVAAYLKQGSVYYESLGPKFAAVLAALISSPGLSPPADDGTGNKAVPKRLEGDYLSQAAS